MRLLTVFAVLAVFAGLTGCGGPGLPERPDSFATTETILSDSVALDSRNRFEQAVVGHQLRGEGVDVVVAPGGVLVGTQFGKPFSGAWIYRRGRFCYALEDKVTRRNAKCFNAAVVGRTVYLVPVEN
jgi:hypothetical protein